MNTPVTTTTENDLEKSGQANSEAASSSTIKRVDEHLRRLSAQIMKNVSRQHTLRNLCTEDTDSNETRIQAESHENVNQDGKTHRNSIHSSHENTKKRHKPKRFAECIAGYLSSLKSQILSDLRRGKLSLDCHDNSEPGDALCTTNEHEMTQSTAISHCERHFLDNARRKIRDMLCLHFRHEHTDSANVVGSTPEVRADDMLAGIFHAGGSA
jgi:hypothetical protein